MKLHRPILGLTCLLGCAGGLAKTAQAAGSLDQPCPVDWRAVPVCEAVRQLAHRLELPYILDPAVSEEDWARTVRLRAAHVNGSQALRWTVRAAGLEAVLVEGALMIAPADRLPLSWRIGSPIRIGDADRSPPQRAGTADIAWLDAPLSRVAKDTSEHFQIDVIFHPQILQDQPLVRLEGQGLNIGGVIRALEEQLGAVGEYDDGVIWVQPKALAASRPVADPIATPAAALAFGGDSSVLSRPIELGWVDPEARAVAESVGRSAGITCRIEPSGTLLPARMAASGSLAEVLEAARMLEGWDWKISPSANSGEAILLIRTGVSGRSVP